MERFQFMPKSDKKKVINMVHRNREKWKRPPKIKVLDGGCLPPWEFEILRDLIREVALRKLRQLREEADSTIYGEVSSYQTAQSTAQSQVYFLSYSSVISKLEPFGAKSSYANNYIFNHSFQLPI
jgi:hypothetical protein